jgi:methylenetetrahydrofolate reductase (NADPH)
MTSARARILTLADALRDDERVAALTLTDRTTSLAADPVSFAADLIARAPRAPLVHLAGKGRDSGDLEAALRRCEGVGVGSVLLTGGDPVDARAPADSSEARHASGRALERPEPARSIDALEMLGIAAACTPALTRIAVAALPRNVRGPVSWERVAAKRAAGADAFIAQVSWDLSEREIVAEWQTRLNAPILGAVVLVTPGLFAYLAAHRITGIIVPPALRARAAGESREQAIRRLALDVVLLRRLGYAGAHVTGILTPGLLTAVLDEATRLDAALGDDWRRVWREAMGLA